MPVDVKHFVSGCELCQQVKDVNQHLQGLLQPLPIPTKKFDSVSIDFTTGLPEHNGKNSLLVYCDKLGKLTRLVPTWVGENHLAVPEEAKLFFVNWVRYYGVPKRLVHDRDVRFTALFWRASWAMLGM